MLRINVISALIIILVLSFVSASEAITPVPGKWEGTTDQKKKVSFVVSPDGKSILDFTITVKLGDCWGIDPFNMICDSKEVTRHVEQIEIVDNEFEAKISDGIFKGVFIAPNTVEGTWSDETLGPKVAPNTWMVLTGSGDWTASNDSIVMNDLLRPMVSCMPIAVSGVINNTSIVSVKVNGNAVQITDSSFTAEVDLIEGENIISIDGYDKVGNWIGYDSITVTFDPTSSQNPIANFTVSPSEGDTSTIFTVDASSSSDCSSSSSALQVRWDWENDGIYDTNYSNTKTATHQYKSDGVKTIKLEVKDTSGRIGTATKEITLKDSVVYLDYEIDDTGEDYGDGDGRAEAGERVKLSVKLINKSTSATSDVSARLSTGDKDIKIRDSYSSYGDIGARETFSPSASEVLEIEISKDAIERDVKFALKITANNAPTWEGAFSIPIYLQDNPPEVVYSKHEVSHETNRQWTSGVNQVIPGEKARLYITLINNGTGSAFDVEAKLTTEDKDIIITSPSQSYGTMAPNGTKKPWSSGSFDFFSITASADAVPHDVKFTLEVTARNGGPWSDSFIIPIKPPGGPVAYLSYKVDDTEDGDGDEKAEAGERVRLFVTLKNDGSIAALGTTAYLSTQDKDIRIWNNYASYKDIKAGGNYSNDFGFEILDDASEHEAEFTLKITAQNGGPWEGTFSIPIYPYEGSPGPVVYSKYEVSGSVNQVIPGQKASLHITLINNGTGLASDVKAELTTEDKDITITRSSTSYGPIPAKGTDSGSFSFTVSTDAIPHKVSFSLEVTARNGGPWSDSFVIPIEPPGGPVVYLSHKVDDTENGDGDGKAEVGERVRLFVTLKNNGSISALGTTARLSAEDKEIQIRDSYSSFGNIEARGGTASPKNVWDAFEIEISDDATEHEVQFTLKIEAQNGGPWKETFKVPIYPYIGSPGPVGYSKYEMSSGINQVIPGEAAWLNITLINNGTGLASDVKAELTAEDKDITITRSSGSYGIIPAKGTESNSFSFTVSADAVPHDVNGNF